LPTDDYAFGVAVAGNVAYVADDESGMQVIDITNPEAPTIVAGKTGGGRARNVAVDGNTVYLTCSDRGLKFYNITDPEDPRLYYTMDTPGTAWDVAVAGGVAFVADGSTGLEVVDVVHAKVPPVEIGSVEWFYQDTAWDVVIEGDVAYVATFPGFFAVDISDPTDPTQIGTYGSENGGGEGLAVEGDIAYVAVCIYLDVVDVSDPTDPTLVGQVELPTCGKGVAVAGDVAYVASLEHGLEVVDVSDPHHPHIIDSVDLPGWAWDVAVAGDLAYVTTGYGGLQVVDISDPTDCAVVNSLETTGPAMGIALAGNMAYVANEDGLLAVDITCAICLSIVDTVPTPGDAWGVAVAGDYVYVGDQTGGMQVVCVSDPANIYILTSVDTPGHAYGLAVAGDVAYVADGPHGFRAYRVLEMDFLLAQDNIGQSQDMAPGAAHPVAARLEPYEIGDIDWFLSNDGGTSWGSFPADDLFHPLDIQPVPSGIHWRGELIYDPDNPFVNPTCSQLDIEWLFDFPIIDVVADVPDDQGGQVNLTWTRSGYDLSGSSTLITEYAIFRRNEGAPGGWDSLMTVPAVLEDGYTRAVSTLVDSTIVGGMALSTFFARALTATPGLYFDSPPDSGYSVDNLAPLSPINFHYEADSVLAWDECPDGDFDYFTVYCSEVDYLDASAEVLDVTTGTSLSVPPYSCAYYHLTATDVSGNEGEEATLWDYASVPETGSNQCMLHTSSPNPFKAQTQIHFAIPDDRTADLAVYSVNGRRIATLVNGPLPAGHHMVTWTGRDDQGRLLPSGVFLYRLTAGDYVETKRLTLLR
ncbi:T9SS type A sorting domain-containing protein, partial [Candidatus Eisenbacteria bacterium]